MPSSLLGILTSIYLLVSLSRSVLVPIFITLLILLSLYFLPSLLSDKRHFSIKENLLPSLLILTLLFYLYRNSLFVIYLTLLNLV